MAAHKIALSWGSGPLVICIHGWNGRAAQLAPLAQRIAWEGYRCVCIDVTAHGESAGNRPAWRHFIDDIAQAAAHFGEVYALRALRGRARNARCSWNQCRGADNYVCVCAPSHPFPPIRTIRQLLNPPPHVLNACRDEIAQQFEATWDRLESGEVWKAKDTPLLLFYDRNDRYVDHTEGDRILQWARDARLEKSSGRGHTRVLASDELAKAVLMFLEKRSMLLRFVAGSRR